MVVWVMGDGRPYLPCLMTEVNPVCSFRRASRLFCPVGSSPWLAGTFAEFSRRVWVRPLQAVRERREEGKIRVERGAALPFGDVRDRRNRDPVRLERRRFPLHRLKNQPERPQFVTSAFPGGGQKKTPSDEFGQSFIDFEGGGAATPREVFFITQDDRFIHVHSS